jgi:hypothetical protein
MEPPLRYGGLCPGTQVSSAVQCSDVAAATEEKDSPTITALIEQLNRDLDELQQRSRRQ